MGGLVTDTTAKLPAEGMLSWLVLSSYYDFIDCTVLPPMSSMKFDSWDDLYNWTFRQALAMRKHDLNLESRQCIMRMMQWKIDGHDTH